MSAFPSQLMDPQRPRPQCKLKMATGGVGPGRRSSSSRALQLPLLWVIPGSQRYLSPPVWVPPWEVLSQGNFSLGLCEDPVCLPNCPVVGAWGTLAGWFDGSVREWGLLGCPQDTFSSPSSLPGWEPAYTTTPGSASLSRRGLGPSLNWVQGLRWSTSPIATPILWAPG